MGALTGFFRLAHQVPQGGILGGREVEVERTISSAPPRILTIKKASHGSDLYFSEESAGITHRDSREITQVTFSPAA